MNATNPLNDQVAVVTGGGRGIGRSIGLAFANAGADVVVVARTATQVEAVTKEISGLGRKSLPVVADVTDPVQVNRAAEEVGTAFGRIDILVNNAGGSLDRSSFLDSASDAWLKTIRLNIDSVYLVSRAFVPHMRTSGGKIINVGSGMGRGAGSGNSSYRVGKAGSWMLTQCLSAELWDRGIDVNELIPGPVATDATADHMKVGGPPPFNPSERVKTADEVAPLALWLATRPIGGPTGQSFSLARRPL